MKLLLIQFIILFSYSFCYSQKTLEFSEYESDFSALNPEWIKIRGYKKLIEREYLKNDTSRIHLIINHYYDHNGYEIKNEYSLKYPNHKHITKDSISTLNNFRYYYKDSFLYKELNLIRYYDENGLLSKCDTLKPSISVFNPNKLTYLKIGNNESKQFKYDSNGNLIESAFVTPMFKMIFKFRYYNDLIISAEKFMNDRLIQKFIFEYDIENKLTKTQVTNTMNTIVNKYYYQNDILLKKVSFEGNNIINTYTFEFQ